MYAKPPILQQWLEAGVAGWCQDLGSRQISIAAWLLTQSPAPLGHLFFWQPCCGQNQTKGDSVHWGPEILNSPTCHPGWPRDSQGLKPSSEELAAPLGPPAFG